MPRSPNRTVSVSNTGGLSDDQVKEIMDAHDRMAADPTTIYEEVDKLSSEQRNILRAATILMNIKNAPCNCAARLYSPDLSRSCSLANYRQPEASPESHSTVAAAPM